MFTFMVKLGVYMFPRDLPPKLLLFLLLCAMDFKLLSRIRSIVNVELNRAYE
jgi:hypothetical protein